MKLFQTETHRHSVEWANYTIFGNVSVLIPWIHFNWPNEIREWKVAKVVHIAINICEWNEMTHREGWLLPLRENYLSKTAKFTSPPFIYSLKIVFNISCFVCEQRQKIWCSTTPLRATHLIPIPFCALCFLRCRHISNFTLMKTLFNQFYVERYNRSCGTLLENKLILHTGNK